MVSGLAKRKSFYPYRSVNHVIELNMMLNTNDWTHIKPADLDLQVGPAVVSDELGTWLDVYGIDERYKAKCCEKKDSKYWIEQVFDESQNDGNSPENIFNRVKRQANNSPYAETNFLKKAFLQACFDKGLFNI